MPAERSIRTCPTRRPTSRLLLWWRAVLDGRDVYDGLGPEVEQLFGITGYDTYPADPPATAVVFSPLSLLAYETAWRLWQAISAALVFGSVVVVAREVGYSPQRQRPWRGWPS